MKGIHELEIADRGHRAASDAVPAPSKFAHPIIGNCIPHIDEFLPNGYTKEEMKMVNETRKIMGDATDRRQPDLRPGARAVLAQRVDPGRDRAADLASRRPASSGPRRPA